MGIRIEIYGHTYVISRACGWRCVSALSFIIILLLLRLSCRAGVGKIVVWLLLNLSIATYDCLGDCYGANGRLRELIGGWIDGRRRRAWAFRCALCARRRTDRCDWIAAVWAGWRIPWILFSDYVLPGWGGNGSLANFVCIFAAHLSIYVELVERAD